MGLGLRVQSLGRRVMVTEPFVCTKVVFMGVLKEQLLLHKLCKGKAPLMNR